MQFISSWNIIESNNAKIQSRLILHRTTLIWQWLSACIRINFFNLGDLFNWNWMKCQTVKKLLVFFSFWAVIHWRYCFLSLTQLSTIHIEKVTSYHVGRPCLFSVRICLCLFSLDARSLFNWLFRETISKLNDDNPESCFTFVMIGGTDYPFISLSLAEYNFGSIENSPGRWHFYSKKGEQKKFKEKIVQRRGIRLMRHFSISRRSMEIFKFLEIFHF